MGLGEVTFPEREDYTFVSEVEVLSGKVQNNVDASWDLVHFDVSTEEAGNFGILGYEWEIPEWEEASDAFHDAGISAGLSAELTMDMPFNMLSYYNGRRVTAGNTFDYNVLLDSVGADTPGINYGVDAYLDLSNIEILGMELPNIEIDVSGSLFEFEGISTPFGTDVWEYEITELVQLDTLSDMINEYIADMIYGINPDIQLQAWVALELEGYMTGTCAVSGAVIEESTEFVWDEQFDTQTTRITVPADAVTGDTFDVEYSELMYHLKVTPGIKLGVSVLGGLVALDHTFFLPVSVDLDKQFPAPDFTETVTVQKLGVEGSELAVDDAIIEDPDVAVSGTFEIANLASVTDYVVVDLIAAGLPAETEGTYTIDSITQDLGVASTVLFGDKVTKSVTYTLVLGTEAHKSEQYLNKIAFKISSTTDSNVYDVIRGESLVLCPAPGWDLITMEDEVDVVPGVAIAVPVTIENVGATYRNFENIFIDADTGGFASYAGPSELKGVAPDSSETVYIDIAVPGLSTSAVDTYTVQMNVNGTVETLTYNVVAFEKLSMGLDLDVPAVDRADEQIWISETTATYYFEISNGGNVAATGLDIYVESDDLSVSSLTSITTVASGDSENVILALDVSSATPGLNSFTIKANDSEENVFFSQTFDINVMNTEVDIYAKSAWEYTDETVVYKITVKNQDSSADTFTVGVNGLDPSTYVIKRDGVETNSVWLPGGQSAEFDLEINPEDVTKTLPGANGIQVTVKSASSGVTSVSTSSAIKLPTVYDFAMEGTKKLDDSKDFYTISFEIENAGNVDDWFTLDISGIGDNLYEVSVNSVSLTADEVDDGRIQVPRGTKVSVSVMILKTEKGEFNPVIQVWNSKGEDMNRYHGNFVYGVDEEQPIPVWGLIALIAIVAIVGVVAAFAVYSKVEYDRVYGQYDQDSRPSRLEVMKERMNEKFSSLKKSRVMKDTSSDSLMTESDSLRPSKNSEFMTKMKDKTSSFAAKLKSKGSEMKDRIQDKRDTRKEERKDVDDMASDEEFWGEDDGWN